MGLPEMKPRLSESRTPFSTPGIYWFGTTPPTTLSSKTKVSSPSLGSGSISSHTSPNWPCPPLCRLWRPVARAFLRLVLRSDVAGYGGDIAGRNFVGRLLVVAAGRDQLRHALVGLCAHIVDMGIRFERSAVDAEGGDGAYLGGSVFEDED